MIEKEFETRNKKFIKKMGKNKPLKKLSKKWMMESSLDEYSYHFRWLGLPIIQFPQDIVGLQEIIWKIKPDLIIETGIARGGSLIFSASMLQLIGKGNVLGIDIEIRKENKERILKHPLYKRIKMIEGSSIDENVINKVNKIAKNKNRILVILDSNHSHDHVLAELKAYSKLVKKGSYMIVFDTVIQDIPNKYSKKLLKGNWSKTDNPKTAVHEFLKKNKRFIIDKELENKLLITVAPDGFLKCIT
ncbi:cephalosporin hydroxylase family protein [Nitrosopumilus ureiphilus]|uniref:Cephalosporin hydroxylase n=1 Tax=Nitrosopumilus ureiphilus TaxID=1470067 RepID=A0A7D5M3M3_9ARCH|nr:cephalosporin hydroxylase family protein [Nitrosopumilus ureiphilus]QLH05793.1 cephalosporin hydroxylase [Nitrosopumilus ureiphilus]